MLVHRALPGGSQCWRGSTVLLMWLVALCTATRTAPGAERIPVINRTEIPLTVWFYDGSSREWVEPQLALRPRQAAAFRFEPGTQYNVVARPLDRREGEFTLGWMDFEALLSRSPQAAVVIQGRPIVRQREVTYTVRVPYTEKRTRQRTVWERVPTADWRQPWRSVPRTVEEEYEVTVYRSEQRTATQAVQDLEVEARAYAADEPLKSRVTFRTQPEGAFVKYRLAGRQTVWIAHNPTISTQELDVGIYVIWTERDGTPASDKHSYKIYATEEMITIPETGSMP